MCEKAPGSVSWQFAMVQESALRNEDECGASDALLAEI